MKKVSEKQLKSLVKNQQQLVAERLVKRRSVAKLTQGDLAKMAGVDRKTVNRIERGHFSPSVETVTRLAAVLKVKVIDLVK